MNRRFPFRGTLWVLVGLLFFFHVGGGWYYSGELIDRAFVPDPRPLATPSGDFQLEEVTYDTPLGPMDAFYLPGSGDRWVIHVHGLRATPAEADHLFAPLQEAGYHQLSITYRNDDRQPLDPSGYYRYGATEHEDVEAAMAYALDNGAESIVFSGFSTGGSHILSFVYTNNLDDIDGIVLDSPNIDMGTTVDFQGSMEELPILPLNAPRTLSWMAKFFTALRIDVNWRSIDYVEGADTSLLVPVLVHHGTDDDSVPIRTSVEFAEANPALITLIQVPGAGHVGSHEVDPDGYVEEVLAFLDGLGA